MVLLERVTSSVSISTYRVDLKIPRLARLVKINDNLFIG